jgi:two-component system cell cycle sensor histidine kinase/response regulator CckA
MRQDDPTIVLREFKRDMGLDEADVQRRLSFVGFTPADAQRIPVLKPVVEDNRSELTEAFFDFLRALPEAGGLLSDPERLREARDLKAAHLSAMVAGDYGVGYAEQRLKLALLYAEAGLDVRVFLGAFHHLLKGLGAIIMGRFESEPMEGFENFMALKKVAFFDIGLIVDTLVHQSERVIRAQQAELISGEEALRGARKLGARLLAIVERSDEIVAIRDDKRELIYINPALRRFSGCSFEEFKTRPFMDLTHPEDRPAMERAIASLLPGQVAQAPRTRVRDSAGHWRWLEGSVSNLLDEEGAGSLVVNLRDITERVQLEERQAQASKLESIGRLAGGVAHDFNNLLTVILGYGDMVREGLAAEDPMRPDVDEIVKAGRRAAELTSQLLAFSRQQVVEPKIIDLNGLVTGMDGLIRRLIGEEVEYRTVPHEELWMLKADQNSLEQVVMNLVVNARDAMPGGGAIVVETGNIELDEAYARSHIGVTPGPHVMLAVSDTGTGMDEATLSRLFEPFFTTKEKGRGTGLGLSTVYGIVKQNGGNIGVYSELGQGTTFKVYFPQVAGSQPSPPAALPAHAARGSETILLVEDDAQVREVAHSILKGNGYNVIVAAGAAEALTLVDGYDGPLDLLLTDVVMPKMNGRELAKQLAQRRPGLRVLYMSGYTQNVIVHHNVVDAGLVLMQKPFSRSSLLQKVGDCLGTRVEGA